MSRRAAEGPGRDCAFPIDLARLTVPEQREILMEEKVRARLGAAELVVAFGGEPEQHVAIATRLARRGNETRLVIPAEASPGDPDPVLLKLLAQARVAREAAMSGTPEPMVSTYSRRHLCQLLRLNWLAPDIAAAIVEGRQPPSLTGRRLLRAADVPLSWNEQRRYFGFV